MTTVRPVMDLVRPVSHFFAAATQPSAHITRRDQQREARALAWVTLAFLPLMGIMTFITLPMAISDLPNSSITAQPMFYIGQGMILVCIAAYILSRTRWFHLGGALFVAALQVCVYLSAVFGDVDIPGRIELLSWLTIAVLLGSFLLTARAMTALCILSIIGVLIFPLFRPDNDLSTLVGVLSFMLVFGVAILVIKRQRDKLEDERHHLLLDRQAELEHYVALRTTELQTVNQRLETLSHIRDEMISNVSHDLRTPITSIKMNHELIRRDPSHTTDYVVRLERETTRLQESIEQLLLVSRLDNGQMPFNPTHVDLNEMASHIAEDRTALAESKRLRLQVEVAPDLPEVFADHALIGQVFSILLTNALNYTPPGGRVLIATAIQNGDTRSFAGFSVSDSGPGIAAEERELIFERFYRGRKAVEAAIPGTGVGLSTVQTIVTQHKGIVELASAGFGDDRLDGWNTVFRIWLPAVQKRPAS